MNYAYRHVRTYENREFIKISFYRQTILDLGIDNLTRSRIRLIPFEIAYSACNIYAIKAIFTRAYHLAGMIMTRNCGCSLIPESTKY